MPIQGFNSEEFAKNLAQQAVEVVPSDLNENQKNYVVNTLYRFCVLAGNALLQDASLTINANQTSIIAQFIAEWTFHKSIDLIRAGIPQDTWDNILQKVAFAVFETAKHTQVNNIEQNKAIEMVENEVIKTYEACIKELAVAGKINQSNVSKVLAVSNIDTMAQENTSKQKATQEEQEKIFKFAAIAILLKNLPPNQVKNILSNLERSEVEKISSFMKMPNLDKQLDHNLVKQFLDDFKKNLSKSKTKFTKFMGSNEIRSLAGKFSESAINKVIIFERSRIKDYVDCSINPASDKELNYEFSPYVSKIIYGYLRFRLSA